MIEATHLELVNASTRTSISQLSVEGSSFMFSTTTCDMICVKIQPVSAATVKLVSAQPALLCSCLVVNVNVVQAPLTQTLEIFDSVR